MIGFKVLRFPVGLLALAALVAGGLWGPGTSQTPGTDRTPPPFLITMSFPHDAVAFIERLPDGSTSIREVRVPGPIGLAIRPDKAVTYVASWTANAIFVLDNALRRSVRTISLGPDARPYSVAFHPGGELAYVTRAGRKDVAVLDATTHRLLTFVRLPGAKAPRNIAFTPDGRLAFISDSESGRIHVLDTRRNRRLRLLDTGGRCAVGVAVSPFGRWLYVADRCLSTVYAVEVESLRDGGSPAITPIRLPAGTGAWYVAFSPDERLAYVSQTEPRRGISSGRIAVIRTEERRVVGEIEVGGFPAGLQSLLWTPDPQDVGTWRYALAVFNPERSVEIIAQVDPPAEGGGLPLLPEYIHKVEWRRGPGPTKTLWGLLPCGTWVELTPEGAPRKPPQGHLSHFCLRPDDQLEYRVTEVINYVDVKVPGFKWRRLRVGDVLPQGARVTTAYRSFATIEVWDKQRKERLGVIRLFSFADVTLTRHLVIKLRRSVDFEIRMGIIKLRVERVTADIKVKSAFATTSIRGTYVEVGHDPERRIDRVAVAEGEAVVQSTVGPQAGQGVTLRGPGDCRTVVRATIDDRGEIAVEEVPFVPEEWPLMGCPGTVD